MYTTLAHLAVSALLALLIIRRTPSVLLGKMGLVSDGSARLERRPYQNQMKLFKSSDCKGFCLYTDFYGEQLSDRQIAKRVFNSFLRVLT